METTNQLSKTDEAQVISYDEVNTVDTDKYIEYCSFKPTSINEKRMLYATLKRCTGLLEEKVDTILNLKNVYFKTFFSKKENTDKVRVILFDDQGNSYVTGSFFVLNDLRNIINIFGEPSTWDEPVMVKVTKVKVEKGEAFSLELA